MADAHPVESSVVPGQPRRGRPKWLLQTIGFTALWFAALFGSAGTLRWTRGWVYFGASLAGMAASGVAIKRYSPGLMEARLKWRSNKDTKRFDRFILAFYLPLSYVQPAVAGLDAVRFRWTSLPVAAMYAGVILYALGTAMIAWTLAVNRFAETTVRIQKDRGHTVVLSGPYRYVRHPMYVGAALIHGATALILGSEWALAVGGVMILLLVVRTALEDATLRRELPGYAEFTERTRYRLVPGVW
jgi:protein-S-isoprenylcysteine O-methyltransferase Ste14